jgi:hypothetical protein
LEKRYIPSRNIKSSNKKKRSDLPMDKKTMDKIKQKNALNRKYMTNRDPNTREEYNRVKTLTNKLKKKHEKDLAKLAKKNLKAIWKYIQSKSKTRFVIGELLTDRKDPNSRKTDDDKEKAEILAEFFQSVFTKEANDTAPVLPLKETKLKASRVK